MKQAWVVLLLVLALFAYFWLQPESNAPQSIAPQAEAPVPATAASPALTPHALVAAPPPSLPHVSVHESAEPSASGSSIATGPARYSQPPKNNIIEFQIVDGLAVAYGDTVLGKPEPGFSKTSGLTELPRLQLWKRGEIPYHVDASVANAERVQQAIQMFHARTGLKFVPYTDQEDAIVFTAGKEHCRSYLGRVGGTQPIFISERCGPTEIAHEVMHALGFVHEQSRTDRDQFVTILWDHILPQYQSQYAIVPESLMEVYGGSPFDPSSILMYDPHTFAAAPDVETMQLKSGQPIRRAPGGLSDADVERVNRLYQN